MTTNKYKRICKPEHPNAGVKSRIYEHTFVMSEMLGRALTELEVVHHIDENRSNNSPKNLQLFATQAEHAIHHGHLRAIKSAGIFIKLKPAQLLKDALKQRLLLQSLKLSRNLLNLNRKLSMSKVSIPVGTRANKVGGSFQAAGTVVGNFKTLSGEQRYVFEFDVPAAMLHIYGPSQLEACAGPSFVERRGLEWKQFVDQLSAPTIGGVVMPRLLVALKWWPFYSFRCTGAYTHLCIPCAKEIGELAKSPPQP